MKKAGLEQSSYKAQFFPRLIYKSVCTPEEVRLNGKRSQIEYLGDHGETIELNQFTYILQHDNGFAFMFENKEAGKKLLIKMTLTVENLADSQGSIKRVGDESQVEWRLQISPG